MNQGEGNIILRKGNIDILKSICAFLIVCIHVPFPGKVGTYFTALTRSAVPIFFMITGYFYSDIVARRKEYKQIKKIAVMLVQSNLIFLLWDLLGVILKGKSVILFFSSTFTVKALMKFIILNESPFAGHLWYLGAILYVLLIVLIMDKLNCRKWLYCVTPLLLITDLLFGKYSFAVFHREFPYIIVRNFLFVGMPYFCLGCLIRQYDVVQVKSRWSALFTDIITKKILLFLIGFFCLTSLIERFILVTVGMNVTRDHYISTTFLAIVIFVFALHKQNKIIDIANFPLLQVVEIIGNKYSTWIYILHPIFIRGIGVGLNKIELGSWGWGGGI